MAIWGMGVMIGPIMGPTLGGFLTANYDWRWVFYINVPFGLAASIGLLRYLPETRRSDLGFDWTGFLMLSLGIGALQALLDRGEQLDWFGSTEIAIEALAVCVGFYCFIVHFLMAKAPFISPRLLADRNFVIGVVFIFMVGLILYATLALLTPYLQTLMGYPVLSAGLTLAPRGLGTMLAMFLCGRLLGRVPVRVLVMFGFLLTIYAMYQMVQFTPDVSRLLIMETGFLQGFSVGFVFVALSTVTFTTLGADLRTQGTSIYSLMRNMGSSIGISVTGALLVRNTQINHAEIGAAVTPFNRMLQSGAAGRLWDPSGAQGAAALDAVINRQASAIAYADDFKLMMIMAMMAAPLILLIREPLSAGMSKGHAAVME
jgi:DHA2 family multidrug resistance protein